MIELRVGAGNLMRPRIGDDQILQWMRSTAAVFFINAVACAFIILSCNSVSAADFEVLLPPTVKHPMVLVSGAIELGDADRFYDAVKHLQSAGVILSGPGGAVSDALQIGAAIQMRGFTTMVLPGAECASACGIIWLSGVRRYMSDDSFIGFHAAYFVQDGVPLETGMGNAEIGSFLTHLGYGTEAIRFLTAAPPNGLNRLTPARARALGIEVYENRGVEIITPEQRPSITRLARNASRISAAGQHCGYLLSREEKDALKERLVDILREGQQTFGAEPFTSSMLMERDRLEFEVGDRGFEWCLTESARVVVEHLDGDPAMVGASFDCSKASTVSEQAVCLDPYLARMDAMMADIYAIGLKGDGPAVDRIHSSQKDWLRVRNRCGGDVACLGEAYRTRVLQLSRTGY